MNYNMVSYHVIGLIKEKTKMLIWNLAKEEKSYIFLEFNITIKQEKYLGICMTKNNRDLFKNYLPTWKSIIADISRLGKIVLAR